VKKNNSSLKLLPESRFFRDFFPAAGFFSEGEPGGRLIFWGGFFESIFLRD
jgi:hypothetical protein